MKTAKKTAYNTESEYNNAMDKILHLMNKGEANLSKAEKLTLRTMAEAAEKYEDTHYPFPMPKTLGEMVEIKMLEKKLNRTSLAVLLGFSTPKICNILNNKRKPDLVFLKALHEKLELDGNFLLEYA